MWGDSCVFCDNEAETISHLCSTCPYSSYIWTLCKLKLGMSPNVKDLWEEALNLKTNLREGTSALYSLDFSCVEQYGIYGRKGIRGFFKTKECAKSTL